MKIIINKIIKIIEDEKWYPLVHPTDEELYASKVLNKTLDKLKNVLKL